MTLEKAIEIVRENCYVFNPLNFDRNTLINSALDMVINASKVNIKEVRKIESKNQHISRRWFIELFERYCRL